jgi:hypothetical protein
MVVSEDSFNDVQTSNVPVRNNHRHAFLAVQKNVCRQAFENNHQMEIALPIKIKLE